MQRSLALYRGSALYHLSLAGRAPADLSLRLEPWPGDPRAGTALLAQEFRFAGEAALASGTAASWHASPQGGWTVALHRFHWLADLAALGNEGAWRAARAWTADWLRRFDVFDQEGWAVDVMGDRIVAWIEHIDRLAGRPEDEALRAALLHSFARQTRHLQRAAHREPGGLARLKALRGLIAAQAALNAGRRLDRACQRLERELDLQILPDGGHAARSPLAQLWALRCLIDARAALSAVPREVPPALQQAIDRSAPMLRFFRHGDGRFALFNGANEEDAATIDRVLARAEAKGRAPVSAPHTGFERLRAAQTTVLIDCGKPPPSGFDAQAHAGTLSFEMSHGRERLIVNCGAYYGTSPEWLEATRSSAAHSTLIVTDTNSVEFRADGTLLSGPTEVTCQRAEEEGAQWVAATHDGYRKDFGLTHARQLFLSPDGEDLRGEDKLTGRAGQGFAIRFHLHPAVQASLTQDGNAVLLRLPGGLGWRLRMQGAVLSIAESIYLGEGTVRKTRQVVLDGHVGTMGAIVKWAIRRETKKTVEPPATLPNSI